jgi:hypothetical protein
MSKERTSSQGASELATPTIKAEKYTTGRGGTGNMAKNDPNHPEIARASQDVNAPVQREPDASFHVGRGGAANYASRSGETASQTAKDHSLKAEKERLKEKEADILQRIGLKK